MNVESESILLRRMEFFRRYDIEVWLSKEVSLNISTSWGTLKSCRTEQTPVLFAGTVSGHGHEDGHIRWWCCAELWSASHLNRLQVRTQTHTRHESLWGNVFSGLFRGAQISFPRQEYHPRCDLNGLKWQFSFQMDFTSNLPVISLILTKCAHYFPLLTNQTIFQFFLNLTYLKLNLQPFLCTFLTTTPVRLRAPKEALETAEGSKNNN